MLGNSPAIFSSFVFQSTVYLPKNAVRFQLTKVDKKQNHHHLDGCGKWKTQKCSRQNAKKLSFHLPRGVFFGAVFWVDWDAAAAGGWDDGFDVWG